MGFGTKMLYLFFINLAFTIKITSSADDIVKYVLIVMHNTTLSIIMIQSVLEAANETDCSSFKVPKIDKFCESGLLVKDFGVAMSAQILETRAADCFKPDKVVNQAALFLIEGQNYCFKLVAQTSFIGAKG